MFISNKAVLFKRPLITRYGLLCTVFFLLPFIFLLSCKKEQKGKSELLNPIIFIPEIHKDHEIYRADSLLFFEEDSLAKIAYQNIIRRDKKNNKQLTYVKAKLLNFVIDTSVQTATYQDLVSEDSIHLLTYLELSKFQLDRQKTLTYLPELKKILASSYSDYYKGISSSLIAKYYDEKLDNLDSAWHYLMTAEKYFKKTTIISPLYQKLLETIISYCTYKRKNLLAIRYANSLFDFEKYYPKADSVDIAKAYANRAFMMFREGDTEGTTEDVELGLSYINPLKNPKEYQHLMKSYLVVFMFSNNDSMWQITINKISENIDRVEKDYVDIDRWYGQYYAEQSKNTEAIPYLKKALTKEIALGNRNSAKYSTLCTLLSLCYENTGNFKVALDYMAMNAWNDSNYEMSRMLDYVNQNGTYSFYDAIRCAQIYFSKYKATNSTESLTHAKTFMKVLDNLMFRQYGVTEENAILQFYEETGQDFFRLGLDIYFESWIKEKQTSDLEAFLNYSDKNKNSLLHRDILMASKESGLPIDVTQKEFALRSAIKEEKRKGLRDNKVFDKLMDEYYLLEQDIEKNYSSFVEKGLVKNEFTIDQLKNKISDDQTCLFIIDETDGYWYYTLVNKKNIFVERIILHNDKILLVDTMIHWMQSQKITDINKKITYRKSYIPDQIFQHLTSKIYFVSDGIYSRFPINYLLETDMHKIVHLPTVSLFDKFMQKNLPNKNVALFAFSDLETIKDTKRTNLVELPGSYHEVIKQSRQYTDAKIFTGKNATKSNFLKMYQDTNTTYIHLALHGLANSAEKDNIKLYFRTENGGLDSLYGYELLRYKSRCQKVVLSACQSGVGAYVSGEGSYSLPRYFMINGATDVVFNYWDVED